MTSIDACVDNALSYFQGSLLRDTHEVYVWPTQHDAQHVVVVIGPAYDACVYLDGDFLYYLDNPPEEFWNGVDSRNIDLTQVQL